jgi:IclR family transcriptional regulator, acetate operon repressor
VALSDDRASLPVPHRVRSVDRAIDLLKAAGEAGGGHTLTALARRCGLDRATAWRLLITLEAQGMVQRDPRDGLFTIGPAVAELSVGPSRSLVHTAQPLLERVSLETGEIACLGVVDGDEIHYVAEVIPSIVSEQSWLRQPVSLHASSMGKAFLAYLDDAKVAELVGDHPTRFTDTTITDVAVLREELRRIRAQGYAVCRGELEQGSWGVAATLLGVREEPVAVVCLWGAEGRGDQARLEALGGLARRTARELRAA